MVWLELQQLLLHLGDEKIYWGKNDIVSERKRF